MENRYIYIIFSSTPYRIGRLIRSVTKEPYNHISLSLDEALTPMYGFARRYYNTPLYGGFVRETPARYQIQELTADICLCRLPVNARQYADIESLLVQMEEHKHHYVYNHLSVFGALVRKRIAVKDAYTCVEFCVKILHRLGLDINPKEFYTVCDLQKLLQNYCIYTGKMPQCSLTDDDFFDKQPILSSAAITVRDMLCLLPRHFQK